MPVWARSRANTFSRALGGLSSMATVPPRMWARASDRRGCPAGISCDRRDDVHQARVNRAARHAVELRRRQRLHEGEPAFSLIARSPRVPSEPVPERITAMLALLLVLGERTKKKSMGRLQPPGDRLRHAGEHAVAEGHVLAGRDDVDVIGLHLQVDPGLPHRHRRRRWSSSTSKPWCVGSRCWIRTKAMPLSGGSSSGTARAPPARRRRRRCRRRGTHRFPRPWT